MIEGLTDEVMTLVERSLAGLSLAEIYRQSDLAETEADVAGALHRLTSRGDLVKGTDKVYRTTRQGREQRLAPPPERPAAPEPKPDRKAAKKTAARKKAAVKPAEKLFEAQEEERGRRFTAELRGLPVVTESLIEDLEQASVDSQVRLDRYLSQLDDPLLDYLIEAASAAKSVAEAARRVADGGEP